MSVSTHQNADADNCVDNMLITDQQGWHELFGTTDDLLARLAGALASGDGRPVAVLCGSGLTRLSVPGTDQVIATARKALASEDDQALFDHMLEPLPTAAERYQRAFQFLTVRQPPSFRDRIIRASCMHAYSKADPTERPTLESMDTAEADVKGWNLSAGVAALGRIWTGLPDERRGPILTTNFDPLVEIGIRRSGGSATPYVQIDDSSFLRNMRVQTGSTSVVHLHGFWREGATQHTPEELELGRPVLAAALRALLQTHTLLIMGYGAWNDVVTRQLLATVREDTQRELDVLWALHESGDALQHALAQSPTMQELRKAPSNVVFYEGIDVETLLPELERRLADVLTYEDRARDESVVHGIVGWSPITQTFIEKRASASSDRLR